jgi:peptide deformylase
MNPLSFSPRPASARLSDTPRVRSGLKLARYPDAALRTVCEPVERFDSSLRDVMQEMFELLRAHAGRGLAGPQVGLRQRVLIGHLDGRPLYLVNPEIKAACDPGLREEECLSLPGIRVRLHRPERLRVTGYDPHGRKTSFGATGWWARTIQHGVDHLNGILICDHARPARRECRHCRLALPAVLIEERKHLRPPRHPGGAPRPF